jgi:maltose alpha-D-glucosyltransferase/alpha-amylase
MGVYLESASAMGRRTADMHVALAADATNPAFAPEPLQSDDIVRASRDAHALAERVLQTLDAALASSIVRLPPDVSPLARRLLGSRQRLFNRLRPFALTGSGAQRIRIHGDYRLAQMLRVEGDLYIQNFEGHPSWPAAAQREKQSPLRDTASMMRSFSYAAYAALLAQPAPAGTERGALEPWARLWHTWAAAAFLQGYLASAAQSPALTGDATTRDRLLEFFMLARALRELDGELNNRPDWVGIPLSGLLELLALT